MHSVRDEYQKATLCRLFCKSFVSVNDYKQTGRFIRGPVEFTSIKFIKMCSEVIK
jgi:hypothetical protein